MNSLLTIGLWIGAVALVWFLAGAVVFLIFAGVRHYKHWGKP